MHAVASILGEREWRFLAQAHAQRADALTAGHRARRARGESHPVEDFLFTYYPTKPGRLRRWHPGAGVRLQCADGSVAPHAGWRWYAVAEDGSVGLDQDAFLAGRGTPSWTPRRCAARTSMPSASSPATPCR